MCFSNLPGNPGLVLPTGCQHPEGGTECLAIAPRAPTCLMASWVRTATWLQLRVGNACVFFQP